MKIKTKPEKVPVSLIEKLDRIRLAKLRRGDVNILLSRRRMLSAIDNIPNLEDVLMKANIKDDRK